MEGASGAWQPGAGATPASTPACAAASLTMYSQRTTATAVGKQLHRRPRAVPAGQKPSVPRPARGRTTDAVVAVAAPATKRPGFSLARVALAVPGALGRALQTKVGVKPLLFASGALAAAKLFPNLLLRKAPSDPEARNGGAGGRKPALVWFRSDLRLHDHEALTRANAEATSVLPVYCFDLREYGKGPNGFDKTGPHRARFILEAVADLRARLRALGSDLVVCVGCPEEVLPALAAQVGAGAVYCHCEVTHEQSEMEARVRRALRAAQGGGAGGGTELRALWGGSTLYHVDDLPFQLNAMPSCYGDFRSKLAPLAVRPSLDSPQSLRGWPLGEVDAGELPSLQRLGFDSGALAQLNVAPFGGRPQPLAGNTTQQRPHGGESEALRHLQAFVGELKASAAPAPAGPSSSSTPGGGSSAAQRADPGTSFSCRISPWLAMGCLSPRRMFHEMRRQLPQGPATSAAQAKAGAQAPPAQVQQQAGGPASWLVFELMWRDFFHFCSRKYALAAAGAASGAGGAKQASAAVGLAAPALVAA